MTIKQLGKAFLGNLLEKQVKQLKQKNNFKVIAVVGSVGKTTTKLAIVKMLEAQVKLQHQAGNYNDRLTVPLVFFGQTEPGIYNVAGWFRVLMANRRMLRQPYPYELVVVELGSDGPGQMKQFEYVQPDITVVTALTDEHMEYFKTLDAVAKEELTAASFSKQVIINVDNSPAKYLAGHTFIGYGTHDAQYLVSSDHAFSGQKVHIAYGAKSWEATTSLLGDPGAKAVTAAVAVADTLGMSQEQIVTAIPRLTAMSGRMRLFKGVQDTTLIDDSYNASPIAVKAALDELYSFATPARIAVLGSMNEMGDLSPAMHAEVGAYCDPEKLDLVVTIGADANKYLAPAAQVAGCRVRTFTSPYEAGEFMKQQLQPQAVVLVKGSQNGVFSEEVVKMLLADPTDESKLVRQSAFWMKRKRAQFKR